MQNGQCNGYEDGDAGHHTKVTVNVHFVSPPAFSIRRGKINAKQERLVGLFGRKWNAELVHSAPDVGSGDPEASGHFGLIPGTFVEKAQQFVFWHRFSHVFLGRAQGGLAVADALLDVGAADFDGEVERGDFGAQAGDEGVFDGVFEFADVSGPAVVVDHPHGVAVDVGDFFA